MSSRSIMMTFRLTPDEYLFAKKQARKAHMSVSDYIRKLLGAKPTLQFKVKL